jgi:hypothetical protein
MASAGVVPEAALEKHLEDVVRVPAAAPALIDFFEIVALIVHFALLLVA